MKIYQIVVIQQKILLTRQMVSVDC